VGAELVVKNVRKPQHHLESRNHVPPSHLLQTAGCRLLRPRTVAYRASLRSPVIRLAPGPPYHGAGAGPADAPKLVRLSPIYQVLAGASVLQASQVDGLLAVFQKSKAKFSTVLAHWPRGPRMRLCCRQHNIGDREELS
jgi:hypothetical protein